MTNEEKNIAIAEFMGGKINRKSNVVELDRTLFFLNIDLATNFKYPTLQYDTDWNWLMKAWEKFRGYKLYEHDYMRHKHIIANHISFGTITEAFEALCEGINWYTNQSNPSKINPNDTNRNE